MNIKERQVYFNGRFVPESKACVSIYDSALMFGDMVFEMTRSFNKKQFKLKEHLERLYASIKYVRIPLKMTMDEMEKQVNKTIEVNEPLFADDDEHRVMINVSRGLLSIYHDVVGVEKGTNVIIADFPLRWTIASMGHLYDRGINAVIPSQRAIPASLLEPKVKNRSRLHYMMANIEVSNYAGDDNWALLLDPDGFIAEGTGDNVFIVKDNKLFTPEPRNILRGISRKYIMEELAPGLDIPCSEKNLEPYDVLTADEAFFSGTPFCILPVTRINGQNIGDGKVGKITGTLLAKWSDNVGVDIIGQIKKYSAAVKGKKGKGPSPYTFQGG
jgi:branched-chain amino acid aminotransferase